MLKVESIADTPNYHCANIADEDILILGSSYSLRDISPFVLEDSLHMKAYNAAESGNGVIGAWARYSMFIQKHTPKVVIFSFTPGPDFYVTKDYSWYTDILKPYHRKKSVSDILTSTSDKLEFIRLESNLYCYNSMLIDYIRDAKSGLNRVNKGFIPLNGIYKPEDPEASNLTYEIDSMKIKYLEMLMKSTRDNNIIFVCLITPYYYGLDTNYDYTPGIQLCDKYNVPVLDYSNFEFLKGQPEYFHDITHLNKKGAILFTKQLSVDLKKIINGE